MYLAPVVLLSTSLLLLACSNDFKRSAANIAHAQVSVPGRFSANLAGSHYRDIPLNPARHRSDDFNGFVHLGQLRGPPPELRLPHLDNAQLLTEEETSRRQLVQRGQEPDGAYQFGKAISIESFDAEPTLSKGRWIPLKNLHNLRLMGDNSDGEEEAAEDVLVWQLEVHSKSALSLNLIFSDFYLPPDTEFYVSSHKKVLGAFTAKINNKPDGVFATAPIEGDRLLLEFYTRRKTLQQSGMPRIQLSHVVHGYKPTLLASSSDLTAKGLRQRDGSIVPQQRPMSGIKVQSEKSSVFDSWRFQDVDDELPPIRALSGKCNIDIACHQDEYQDQGRSVGVILTDYNQKYCTGAMINNVRQDGRQLFLTANHCAGFSDTSAHLVMFNHEKIQCGPEPEVVNEHDTAMGLVKLANYAPSDFTLYEIIEPIPDAYNLYLSGWSALPKAPSSRPRVPQDVNTHHKEDPSPLPPPSDPSTDQIPIVGIHHPSGDSKKISFFYNGSLPKACWSECGLDEYYHWQIPRWDQGTTEPGSSGSPLFDADKRIVGQLHGGSASCWNKNGYDVYGAIHASFQEPPKIKNRLTTYLDPEGTGTKFMDGYSLEVARRDNKERQRGLFEEEKEDEGEIRRVGPLAVVGLEKPNYMPEQMEEQETSLPGDSTRSMPRSRYLRHRGTPDMFERLSAVFDRVWRQSYQ